MCQAFLNCVMAADCATCLDIIDVTMVVNCGICYPLLIP